MNQNEKRIVLPADANRLPEVEQFINEQLEKAGCPIDTQTLIGVSVEEVYVNVAHYAYAPDTGDVTITAVVEDDPLTVRITFADSGKPFDPLAKEDPDIDLPTEEREIGGLGIFMTKQLMDDVSYEYRDGMNILTIKKALA